MYLEKIKEILKDKSLLIELANVCDKAYSEGVGKPEWYSPFGEESPEKIARNIAALQAVITGVGIINHASLNSNLEKNFLVILQAITRINTPLQSLSANNIDLLLRLANACWGAGELFRTDRGTLGRLTNLNIFDLLPEKEVEKDLIQILATAKWLIKQLK